MRAGEAGNGQAPPWPRTVVLDLDGVLLYLEAARHLGAEPGRCVAIEDSTNGLRAAGAGGMTAVASPAHPLARRLARTGASPLAFD